LASKNAAHFCRQAFHLEDCVTELEQKTLKHEIILTRKEAAKQLSISLPTLTKLTKSGKIKCMQKGPNIFYYYIEIFNHAREVNFSALQ